MSLLINIFPTYETIEKVKKKFSGFEFTKIKYVLE